MKKTYKIAALFLCVGLIVGILVGCGGTSESKDPNQEPAKGQESNSEEGTWVVGTSPDYPPFEFVDDKGEYAGFDIDLAKEVGKRLGKEVKIEALEFEVLIEALKSGKIDAIISCMNPTPPRLEEADFTDTYFEVKHGILVKPDGKTEIKELDDVLKYEFGVQTGTSMDDWATKQIEEGKLKESQLKRYTDANAAVMDVKSGRIAAFVADLPIVEYKAKQLDLEVAAECKLSDEADPGIVVAKGSDMLDKLNEIVKEMKEDGTIKELEEKWFTD